MLVNHEFCWLRKLDRLFLSDRELVIGVSMLENQKIRVSSVMGPLGTPLTLETLPPASTTRWVPRRKAEVVAAVNGGLLLEEEACRRYSISNEELEGWRQALSRSGIRGLRVTRIQEYRSDPS